MKDPQIRALRKTITDMKAPTIAAIIRTIDAQAAAINTLTSDAQDAFAEYRARIAQLDARISALEHHERD